jgi:hypothetical protein
MLVSCAVAAPEQAKANAIAANARFMALSPINCAEKPIGGRQPSKIELP